jgi:hypothetical protein
MNNFKNNIDKLVSRILNEEIESKVKQFSKKINEGEWTEIEMDEELKGNQKKIDVAEPKGKITAADFEKLRKAKSHKKEVEEFFYGDDEDEEYDEDTLDKIYGEIDRVNNPMSRPDDDRPKFPKMMGSFDDEHGFYDQDDRQYTGDFDFDYDEEEFDDFDSFDSKYGGKQRMFDKGDQGRKFFDMYKDKFGKPFRVRTPRNMEEAETEEGNAFTGALANAKKHDKDSFEVDGKKFNVKESNRRILNQMNLASIIKSVKKNVNSLKLTENELIDMIENIVKEQQVEEKLEKGNISEKEPQGLKDTNKVLNKNKQVNDTHTKEVVKKMKDYMKDMVSGGKGYEENPDDFPQSNYDMEKDAKVMKYNPSDAVEEYIEAFAYPGMTNLVYDEIKPDDEKIDKYLKGDSTTGNAVTSKGKALGNVSKRSEITGGRFKQNFDENLYGAEQQKGSYKRQTQPVDVAGDKKQSGSLRKNSIGKAEKIMNQLESTEDKKSKIIAEEMGKMKNLIGYNRKTQ